MLKREGLNLSHRHRGLAACKIKNCQHQYAIWEDVKDTDPLRLPGAYATYDVVKACAKYWDTEQASLTTRLGQAPQ